MTIFTKKQLDSLESQYRDEIEAEPTYKKYRKQLDQAKTWQERFAIVGHDYKTIKGPNNWHESAIKDEFGVDILPELQEFYALGLDELDCVLFDFDHVLATNRSFRHDKDLAASNLPFDHLFFFGGNGLGDHYALAYHRDGSLNPWIWVWEHETDDRKQYCWDINDLIARHFGEYGGFGEHLIF